MRSWRWYSKVLFALLVAAFAYSVWPTPWMYGLDGTPPRRVNRLTGQVEYLTRMMPYESGTVGAKYSRTQGRYVWDDGTDRWERKAGPKPEE